jgi:hypothetical protein
MLRSTHSLFQMPLRLHLCLIEIERETSYPHFERRQPGHTINRLKLALQRDEPAGTAWRHPTWLTNSPVSNKYCSESCAVSMNGSQSKPSLTPTNSRRLSRSARGPMQSGCAFIRSRMATVARRDCGSIVSRVATGYRLSCTPGLQAAMALRAKGPCSATVPRPSRYFTSCSQFSPLKATTISSR